MANSKEEFKNEFVREITENEIDENGNIDNVGELYTRGKTKVYYIVEEQEDGFLVLKTTVIEKIEKETGNSYFMPTKLTKTPPIDHNLKIYRKFIEKENGETLESNISTENYYVLNESEKERILSYTGEDHEQ